MKKTCLTFILLATLGGCTKLDLQSADAIEEEQLTTKQSKQVQFVISGITEEYSTRATISSAGMTDLWVWEGTTLLKHQVSTDEDFGVLSVTLTYGAHDLTFVASKATGQALTDGVWTCTKVSDTFAKQMPVTVSGGSSTSRQVELKRRAAKVMFTSTDNVPDAVSKVYIKVASHKSLDADLSGGTAFDYDATVDVASKHGQTCSNFAFVLPSSATDEEDCAFTVKWLAEDNTALYTYERTLSIKANRCTNLTGAFFSTENSRSMTVSLSSEWDTALDVDLFPSEE